jgi:hypothetical protein
MGDYVFSHHNVIKIQGQYLTCRNFRNNIIFKGNYIYILKNGSRAQNFSKGVMFPKFLYYVCLIAKKLRVKFKKGGNERDA